MHIHTHACTHTHACVVNMIISCKWPPPLGESMGIPYDVIHTCVCVHAHACAHVWGHPLTTPQPHPPTPHPLTTTHPHPQGGTPGISQNSIALELIKIFQFCLKDLKSVETSPPKGGCIVWWVYSLVGGWVGRWVESGQITKNLKIC